MSVVVASQFIDNCNIKRRIATDINGGIGADKYDLFASNEPCLFIEKPGRLESQDEQGRDIISDGKLRIETEILETDLIVLNNIEYKVLVILPARNRILNKIEYYIITLQRRRKFTDALEQLEPIIHLN